jgi:hypothetical protein
MTNGSICSICHRPYIEFGNNASPFPGRCCNECNDLHVIPARIRALRLVREEDKKDKNDVC